MSAWDIGLSLRQASRSHAHGIAARTLTADGKQVAEEITWAELHADVRILSTVLTATPGLRRGDRLGVLGRNSVEHLELMYACADAGVIFVPLNIRWSIDELRHAVADSGINVMAVTGRDFLTIAMDLSRPTEIGPAISCLVVAPWATVEFPSSGHEPGVRQWRTVPVGRESAGGQMKLPDERDSLVGQGLMFEGFADRGLPESRRQRKDQGEGHDAAENAGNAANSENQDGVEDVFCIVYTSGTTGRSKGVALTHLGQVMQAMGKCLHVGYTSSTAFLSVVPFSHVGGISSSLAVTMVAGCHVFLPHFTPASGSSAVQLGCINTLVVVPTMLHMILNASHGSSTDEEHAAVMTASPSPLAGVKTVLVGGQPLSRRLECLARARMPEARFIQTYACTEAGSTITFWSSPVVSQDPLRGASPAEFTSLCDTVSAEFGGMPAANVEVRVVEKMLPNTATARCCAPGVVGEIETRGPHVMKGYWGRPELTNEVIRLDGWLRTGDLGRLDERSGHLVFVGRMKDMIKTGGENVHASEVESVLLRHAWVVEAVAYGVEDERLGEKVAASVVLGDAAYDDAGAVSAGKARTVLTDFCRLHLSHYKQPRHIQIVPALPRNSAGKVLRHRLRSSL